MQIHELTKRRKERTDEGLLDNIKAGISAAKAVGQAAMSPTFGAVASNQGALNSAEKLRQQINKKYGLNIQGAKRGAGDLIAPQATNNQQQASQQNVQQQVQAMTQSFVSSPTFADLSQVLPDPGQMLMVVNPANKGQYYKDANGIWYAEAESTTVPPKQVPPNQTKMLDDLINKDQYKQVPSIIASAPAVPPQTKGAKKPATPAATTPPVAPTDQPATTPATTPVSEAAGGFNRKALAIKQAKELVAKTVVPVATKNKINPKQVFDAPEAKKEFDQITKIAQAPVSKIKSSKDKKQRLKKAFAQYATTALTSAQGETAQAGQPGTEQDAGASPQEKAMAVQTITKSGVADGAKIEQEITKNPQLKQAFATITKESLEEKLNNELLSLNESQVFITKDIVVKTPKGDYTKRHTDQQWYDPNGVLIDQDKYADYIKKLDATPAAQTRYQADSKNARGSDKAVMNPSIKLEPPQPAPQATTDPLQQMADDERLRAIMRKKDVDGLNAMVQDTFNQLQNAKIFKTGQEDYLQSHLDALIAMKV